ncbi:MAG: DUF418 domain-containing protein, partial [Porphyrobacter sp.]|nr:DUF418 domain-containing protein [Porphyrobacter sp.]
ISLCVFYVPQWVEALPQIHMVERGMEPGAPPALRASAEAMLKKVGPSDSAADIERDKREHDSIPAHVRAAIRGDAALDPWQSVPGYGLETLGFMLIGIAGFKSGFLTGAWSRRSYAVIAASCLGVDLLVHAWAVYLSVRDNFAPLTFIPWTRLYVSPLHAVGAIGYAALIILLFGQRSALADRFAAVGRAAFTNYLGSTLIGVLLFYGTFGGLYGQLSRGQVWLFVPAIWAAMLLWSKPWLDRYNYGPFEWAWRSQARWKLQPMRKGPRAPVLAEA